MARPLRIEFPDALYHVTSRGNEQRPIFRTDRDRTMFLLLLGKAVQRFRWSVTAYVLMTNHYHLVIQTAESNLSRGMQWLNGTYAAWFNRTHRRSGHLFQGRFHGLLVEKQTYFSDLLRYVVLNPVRAGIVNSPGDYQWSSYRATAGLEVAPEWLDVEAALHPLGEGDPAAAQHYRAFVQARVSSRGPIWSDAVNGIYLGTAGWAITLRERVEARLRSTDHPRIQRAVGRPGMAAIVAAVSRAAAVSPAMLRRSEGKHVRGLAAWLGWHEGLVTLRSIAASLRLRSEGYVSNLIRRCERMLGDDGALLLQMDRALAMLRQS